MIITCWNEDPTRRWEVPAMRELFSTLGSLEVRNVEAGWQQCGRFLPRITSPPHFPQVPEPEIERAVDEMDKVDSPTSPTFPQG